MEISQILVILRRYVIKDDELCVPRVTVSVPLGGCVWNAT